jgi:zinc/manganese transport system ATP-binding protein
VTQTPVLRVDAATLQLGDRSLWRDLSIDVLPGEFVAVLGANGSGKSTLLRSILGEQRLDAGSISVAGGPIHRGDRRIGYIPQQKLVSPGTPLRGRDLVTFGLNGHRFGLPIANRDERARVDRVIASVGASTFADRPLGSLSGGEQQRLRVGQAVVGEPILLLCDEPLASLDLHHQRAVSELIDTARRSHHAAVIFVTHDINPVLGMVDRILYLAGGRHRIGTPDEVLTSEVLSDLYDTPVDVLRIGGRVIVAGVPDTMDHDHHLEARP